MSAAFFPEIPQGRPLWLVTLADLSLLLLGFFVLVAAHKSTDRKALAAAMRARFGVAASASARAPTAALTPETLPLAAAALYDFAPGAAAPYTSVDPLVAWARAATRDTRVTVRVTGLTDGSTADVDAESHSAVLLAVDRARGVARAIAQVVPGDRVMIATADSTHKRGVMLTLSYSRSEAPNQGGNGNRQDLAGRQCRSAGC